MNLSRQLSIAMDVVPWITGIPARIPIVLVLGCDAGDDTLIPVSGFLNAAGREPLVGGNVGLKI